MKSFYEQFKDRVDPADGTAVLTIREYEDIQLYAWKEGMTKALELVEERAAGAVEADCDCAADDIRALRDSTDTVWPRRVI